MFRTLAFNSLSGMIPAGLGNLVELSHLCLNGNEFCGHLPPQLGQLTNLTKLYGMMASDSIERELTPQCSLLENNQISGIIPQEIGELMALQILYEFQDSS